MTEAMNALIKTLSEEFPHLKFVVYEEGAEIDPADNVFAMFLQQKAETFYIDDERAPEQIVSIVKNDFCHSNPMFSECERFTVDPQQEYGIPLELARRISMMNGQINLK